MPVSHQPQGIHFVRFFLATGRKTLRSQIALVTNVCFIFQPQPKSQDFVCLTSCEFFLPQGSSQDFEFARPSHDSRTTVVRFVAFLGHQRKTVTLRSCDSCTSFARQTQALTDIFSGQGLQNPVRSPYGCRMGAVRTQNLASLSQK